MAGVAPKDATKTSDSTATAVAAVAELLPLPGSGVGDEAVAVADRLAVCAAATATTTLTERVPPGTVAPAQEHTTGLAALQAPPALAVAETKLVPVASGNEIVTSCASDTPPLVTVAR